jgi:hypothetical protein
MNFFQDFLQSLSRGGGRRSPRGFIWADFGRPRAAVRGSWFAGFSVFGAIAYGGRRSSAGGFRVETVRAFFAFLVRSAVPGFYLSTRGVNRQMPSGGNTLSCNPKQKKFSKTP